MVNRCCVKGCRNGTYSGKSLYRLLLTPKKKKINKISKIRERRRQWLTAIRRTNFLPKSYQNAFVCEDHFISKRPAPLSDDEDVDWVPNRNLPSDEGENIAVIQQTEGTIEEGSIEEPTTARGRSEDTLLRSTADIGPRQTVDPDLASSVHFTGGTGNAARVASSIKERSAELLEDSEVGDPIIASTPHENERERARRSASDRGNGGGAEEGDGTIECVCKECQTDLTLEDMADLSSRMNELSDRLHVLSHIARGPKFTEEELINDNEKCLYFTGIPCGKTLVMIFKLVSPHLSDHPNYELTKFERFILTLMRLRLDVDFRLLAHIFQISPRTVSRTFFDCLDALYDVLKDFISWPERDVLYANMPPLFKESFGNKVTVIIDCFEVFIVRPTNVLARAQTWSNYKHHNTIKILIGITPWGTISFISEAFGGRCSDKFVTESGFLDMLRPRDLILADRGFLIEESVALLCAEVKVPAFTKGKRQLSAVDVRNTRKIAHVRIHVERVIGLLRRKFKILFGVLPIHLLMKKDNEDMAVIDKIITVCCALVNLCPPSSLLTSVKFIQ